jgi:predicted glycogen debranching enzyme
VQIIRELHLHWRQQAVTLRYRIAGLADDETATFTLHPMLALRDFHSLMHESQAGGFNSTAQGDVIRSRRDNVAVTLHSPGAKALIAPDWWRRFHYACETARGQDDREDLYLPGYFERPIKGSGVHEVVLTAALGDTPAQAMIDDEPRRTHLAPVAAMLQTHGCDRHAPAALLAQAADDFVVTRKVKGQPLATIIAGYPWFADWGRDTFIAMEGLLLTTGRQTEALATLKAFAEAIQDGLVPNRFDDYNDSAAHYNTVDASLWFVHAAMRYVQVSGDDDAWRSWLAPACKLVIDAYIKGTRFDIRMAGDGLISAGSPQTQLTWMDAANNGVIFTPRHGKAVEINALWFHVLSGMSTLIAPFDKTTAGHYDKLISRIKRAFVKVFWDDQRQCLFDHVWTDGQNVDHRDGAIRPNQVLACSLEHSPLPRTKQQQVLQVISDKLLTPYGLRTLPPGDPNYHGHYQGSMFQRDKAYHQGTVWPWLIGPYAEALLRVGKFSPSAKKAALAALTPLLETIQGQGDWPALGQLHEVHDADAPHAPGGCPAQAWSVAEVIRVLAMIG